MSVNSFPLHTCHFFNIFVHTDYVQSNKGGNLTIMNCQKESKAILESPVMEAGMTPGFRVCLETKVDYRYFFEVDATLVEGKDAFIYLESDTGVRYLSRTSYRFKLCERAYYSIEFQAVSRKTYAGILFFCSDVLNRLKITNFRLAPYIDMNNFADEDVSGWKCFGGQHGLPQGCTACFASDCPDVGDAFRGPQGAVGVQGADGLQGPLGSTGEVGSQGAVGPQGGIGPQGEVGAQGDVGVDGNQGPQGNLGNVGPQGAPGPIGVAGEVGPPGSQGMTGDRGLRGYQGNQGNQGVVGSLGGLGPQGDLGNQGDIGNQGEPGPEPTTGSWTTGWNRLDGGVAASSTFQYQIVNDVVSLFFQNIDFDAGAVASTIVTSVNAPAAIRPSTDQIFTLLIDINNGTTIRLVRMTLKTTGELEISRDYNAATTFAITEQVSIVRRNQQGGMTFTYML